MLNQTKRCVETQTGETEDDDFEDDDGEEEEEEEQPGVTEEEEDIEADEIALTNEDGDIDAMVSRFHLIGYSGVKWVTIFLKNLGKNLGGHDD